MWRRGACPGCVTLPRQDARRVSSLPATFAVQEFTAQPRQRAGDKGL